MKHTHGEGVLFVAMLAALVACADPTSRTVGLSVPNNAQNEPTHSSANEERAALSKIARLVAVAMDKEPARQHLKRDMRAAYGGWRLGNAYRALSKSVWWYNRELKR